MREGEPGGGPAGALAEGLRSGTRTEPRQEFLLAPSWSLKSRVVDAYESPRESYSPDAWKTSTDTKSKVQDAESRIQNGAEMGFGEKAGQG